MPLMLHGLHWQTLVLYLDDVVIFAADFSAELKRLEDVFLRLRKAKLELKPKKCCLFQKQVTFLGHLFDEKGNHPDPSKVSKLLDWPSPTNVKFMSLLV